MHKDSNNPRHPQIKLPSKIEKLFLIVPLVQGKMVLNGSKIMVPDGLKERLFPLFENR